MRFCTLLLSLLLVPCALAAQVPGAPGAPGGLPTGPGRISGVVTGAENQPLQTVGVTLRSAGDSAIVTGALTDTNGRFRIDNLPVGRYLLRVSVLGYMPRNSEVIELTAAAPAVDLGTIALEVSAVALDALEATAERDAVVIEADRTTYNVRAMPVASAGMATDVLRSVPELEVDVNNNVRLRGNQAVAVHINGRPAPLRGEQLGNFLQQLPGNRIERVEVLPNPSARHDPEGMGGIVNIVLRENLDLGLSGSATVNASTRGRQFVNGRLNYQKGRLTLFTGGGFGRQSNLSSNWDLRHNLAAQPVTIVEQNSTTDNTGGGWNLDWTAEFKAGKQATVWSNAWMYYSDNSADGTTAYGILHENEDVRERYDRQNESGFDWGNYNFGLGFKQIFQQQREELTIDGRLSLGQNDTETLQRKLIHVLAGEQVSLPLELTLNEIDSGNGNLSVQADYFRPLGRGRVEVGYRAWQRTQDNDNLLRIFASPEAVDPREQSRSGYEYEEVFHSLYSTVMRPFGKLNVQGGLRAERATTTFDSRVADASFERSYNTLFPSLNLSYTVRQGRTARFMYSKRISRPMPFYLDPFVPSTDPLNVSVGNPDLRPSHTQSFTVDYSHSTDRGTIRVAPYYRRTTDIWERIRTVDGQGVATNRWENGQMAEAYGSNFTLSLRPVGRLSGSTTLNVYRDVRDGTNISSAYRRSATMWSLGGNMAVKLRESLTAQAFANHFPTQSILQGRASGYTFSNLAIRQQVGGTKGSVSLTVMDPLNLVRYNSTSSDATYRQNSRTNMTSRIAMVGFTYNFGKPPQQQSRRSGPEEAGETIRVR